ncbi:hypothetical protein L861_09870 [Litchfieldella anticariensis FP35 = DSM 16096]|uniref:Cupin type-2 domain-containing protein n=1 Tax=Litchfieldella anticariensis (strain DSM 16096 / CECT 5854 / CIP 108499 / LMG 22089 / FP35) TaxID=1121939 RepID=S2LCX5_LITA3|nr:cupin domain-containing protein [Halomonas anticariensis]EPC02641.1 hypothetical protein L861_09870 [Halomonas anticariensis FP35 = DSM 16096]
MQNLFESITENIDEEVFDIIVEGKDVRVERIVSKGHSSPDTGWYDQDRNEWVIVLKGAAILAFEQGGEVTLKPGDHVNIPAHEKHRVKWTAPDQETIWLAVHYT